MSQDKNIQMLEPWTSQLAADLDGHSEKSDYILSDMLVVVAGQSSPHLLRYDLIAMAADLLGCNLEHNDLMRVKSFIWAVACKGSIHAAREESGLD